MTTHPDSVTGHPSPTRLARLIGIGFLCCAAFVFLARTLFKFSGPRLYDFGPYYTASLAWLKGGNPYDYAYLQSLWVGFGDTKLLSIVNQISVNPPTTAALLTPFTLLSPDAASLVWMWMNAALVVLTALALIHITEVRWR